MKGMTPIRWNGDVGWVQQRGDECSGGKGAGGEDQCEDTRKVYVCLMCSKSCSISFFGSESDDFYLPTSFFAISRKMAKCQIIYCLQNQFFSMHNLIPGYSVNK